MDKLKLGEITPLGYMAQLLRAQADGLSGHLHELAAEAGDNSAWLGGSGDGWERGPYYVYGLLPLAVQLGDKALLERVQKWIECILCSGREDGDYGPLKTVDRWPKMVVNKLLLDYYDYSSDSRIIPFLTAYYQCVRQEIEAKPYASWAWAREGEEAVILHTLYKLTKDDSFLILSNKLAAHSLDWAQVFSHFPYPMPSDKYLRPTGFNVKKVLFYAPDAIENLFGSKRAKKPEKIKARNQKSFSRFYHITHGVNIAMAFKYPVFNAAVSEALLSSKTQLNTVAQEATHGGAVTDAQTDNACLEAEQGKATSQSVAVAGQLVKRGYLDVIAKHGFCTGLYSCSEHTMGTHPSQGTEICTMVEAMNSFEKLYQLTEDGFWQDALERVGFGALPAGFTPDMCAHQYLDQPNQISVTVAKRGWYDSYSHANLYGLKPNYGCCMANMHQGFPKLTEHFSYRSGDKIIIATPAPHKINTVNSTGILIAEIDGNYPFDGVVRLSVAQGSGTFAVRRPAFADYLLLDGVKHTEEYPEVHLTQGEALQIEYPLTPRTEINPDGSYSVFYGNLPLALPIEYQEKSNGKRGKFSDRCFLPLSEWRYGLTFDSLVDCEVTHTAPSAPYPFEKPALSVKIKARRAAWKTVRGSADSPLNARPTGQEEIITLVPMGATRLRITQFPYFAETNA